MRAASGFRRAFGAYSAIPHITIEDLRQSQHQFCLQRANHPTDSKLSANVRRRPSIGLHSCLAARGDVEGYQNRHNEQGDAVPQEGDKQLAAGLYIVGTPIGNLEDITLRALRVLREVDVILAEDTRHSHKLLCFYDIQTRVISFHEHNERGKQQQVLQWLRSGMKVALVSDAGMPLVSDPGSSLVRAAAEEGFRILPIPGPSAVLAALVASGLPTSQFHFCGFLPPKQNARLAALKEASGVKATLIFFAPPHSLQQVLNDMAEALSAERRCVIARELTKVHEEFFRGTLEEAAKEFSTRSAKGEITIAVEGLFHSQQAVSEEEIEERLKELLSAGMSPSAAAKTVAKCLTVPKNVVYDRAMRLKDMRTSSTDQITLSMPYTNDR